MDKFSALADPTRRNIIERLASDGQLSASEICEQFSISPQAVSQHLKILREANLVQVEKKAQQRIYRLNAEAMAEVEQWVNRMKVLWEERYDFEALDKVLQEEQQSTKREE
jgi:DNA-binding transcriptional ArsR family regulator